jgi:hypothetical protein
MPTESLILRRVFPVPVTLSDLKRARDACPTLSIRASALRASDAATLLVCDGKWHAAIKEATGAIDEVYAVIDGHEVRIATVNAEGHNVYTGIGPCMSESKIADLLIKADEAGYWQRPHEVVHHLEESQMSHKTMGRIAQNSFIVAGGQS